MSDEGKKEHRVEERPRPITVSDLEARPGSPSIVVVPGSRSSEDETTPAEPEKIVKDLEVTPKRLPPGGKLAPISLDTAWKSATPTDLEVEGQENFITSSDHVSLLISVLKCDLFKAKQHKRNH